VHGTTITTRLRRDDRRHRKGYERSIAPSATSSVASTLSSAATRATARREAAVSGLVDDHQRAYPDDAADGATVDESGHRWCLLAFAEDTDQQSGAVRDAIHA
jgi:hypothetical protein